ncbi:putative zinc finger/helix-turn-helix protein, YgiT family [Legionella busanensis]|uniref:Putative zinc finger/helix-turn-helix protein, YgiT family n=1 Tax=Legionella busanensis TaxID=190655 RepID=A0A378K9R8_9GAMM|nr:DNA-binding transcriptional regulator [Legionella busanensis]STX81698.1 putative zinc finger/helix-turn-helix protein, YgiT family [Legionella busanensis]
MPRNKTYKSEAMEAIHSTVMDMYDAGVVDKKTLRKFDQSCLTPIGNFLPQDIKALREQENVSQSVFANCLNVSKDLISQWERGVKKPAGTSLKLLSLISKKGLKAVF